MRSGRCGSVGSRESGVFFLCDDEMKEGGARGSASGLPDKEKAGAAGGGGSEESEG